MNAGVGVLDSGFNNSKCGTALYPTVPPQLGNCISTVLGNVNVGGNPFPYASNVTANLGADWNVVDFGDGKLTLHGDTSYTGRYYYDVFGDYFYVGTNPAGQPFTDRNAGKGPIHVGSGDYWLLNARLSFQTKRYSVAAYVKNLTDKLDFPNGINVEVSYGSDYLIRAAPRAFGAEVSYNSKNAAFKSNADRHPGLDPGPSFFSFRLARRIDSYVPGQARDDDYLVRKGSDLGRLHVHSAALARLPGCGGGASVRGRNRHWTADA